MFPGASEILREMAFAMLFFGGRLLDLEGKMCLAFLSHLFPQMALALAI